MRNAILRGLTVVVALVVSIPISFIATFVLWPLWGWLERELGIESIGHSAPAQWCFIATYVAVLALVVTGWILLRVYGRGREVPGSDGAH